MAKLKSISLDEVPKEDMVICPECGVLFIKTVRGETWSLFEGKGIYCPVCDALVVKKNEKGDSSKQDQRINEKRKDEENWF